MQSSSRAVQPYDSPVLPKCVRRLVPAVLAGLAVTSAWALPAPSLYVSFDRSLDGIDRNGEVIPAIVSRFPTLVPGKRGNAMRAGPLTGQVEFPSAGILSRDQGSVEMWISPVDWDGSDNKFHVFFEARSEGALYLYKYFDSPRALMLATDNQQSGPYNFSASEVVWRPGEWRHLVGTWSGEGVRLYVDGKPATPVAIPAILPNKIAKTFNLGDSPWHNLRISSSLIDEVRIYDVELSPREVGLAYLGDHTTALDLAEDGSSLTFSVDPDREVLDVRLRTDARGSLGDAVTTFRIGNAEVPARQSPPSRFRSRLATASLPYAGLPPGSYDLIAEVSRNGKVALRKSSVVEVPGLTARRSPVRQPLTAAGETITAAQGRVSVWGREYRFDGGLFPQQIMASDQALLGAPIALDLVANGRAVSLAEISQSTSSGQLPGEIVVDSRSVLKVGSSAEGEVRVVARAQSDGLVWFTVDFAGVSPVTLDSATLRIPMAARWVKYRHRWADAGPETGAVAAGKGSLDRLAFVPFYWLGDDERGLFWFSETARDWPNGQESDAIELVRVGGQVHLVLRLKKAGQAQPNAWTFSFGLQATPVRPLRAGWRRWQFEPAHDAAFHIIWPEPNRQSFKYYGYPEPADPAAFSARIKELRGRGLRPIPYVCPSCVATNTPEWAFYQRKWSMGMVDAPPDVAAYGAGVAMVSPRDALWRSFIVTKTGQLVDQFGIDALYLDNTHLMGAFAPNAGLGYERKGVRFREYPMMAYRDLYREIRAEVLRGSRDAVIIAHSSGSLSPPLLSGFDMLVNGEQFRGRVRDSYLKVTSLEAFRAEFSGRQWGVAPMFIPEFPDAFAKAVEPTRGLMALLMLHDIAVWPIWCNVDEVNRAVRMLKSFGYEDADFVPYFAASPPANSEVDDVYVSGYRRGGSWLLVVANTADSPRAGRVCLSEKLALQTRKWRSVVAGRPVKMDDAGCFTTRQDPLDYDLMTSVP